MGNEKQEKEAMNGVHCSFRCSSRGFQCDDQTTPTSKDDDHHHHKHKGDHHPHHKHRSAENSFSSRSSLSRTSSRSHNSTSSTSRFACKSRKSTSSPTTKSASEQSSSLSSSTPSCLSKSSSIRPRSTTPIMFSNSSGMLKPPAILKQLECSLEDLCYGCQKKIKITREVVKGEGCVTHFPSLLSMFFSWLCLAFL